METELVSLLSANPLLSCLSLDDWAAIGAGRLMDRHSQGEMLYQQGQAAKYLYLLVDGEVLIHEPSQPTRRLGPLTAGELVGAEALVSGAIYAHSALTVTPIRVWPIAAEHMRAYLDDAFDTALRLLAGMAASLCATVRDLSGRKLRSAPERLASYLVELSEHCEGPALLTLPVAKKALAAQLGMEPETLSRAFLKLRCQGVETDHAHRVAIRDIAKLRVFAVQVVTAWGQR